jgi:hypothetical protein
MAKDITQHKEVPSVSPSYSARYCAVIECADAFVECTVAEGVRVERKMLGAMVKLEAVFSKNRPHTFRGILIIYILNYKWFVVYI